VLAPQISMRERMAMYNANALKIGLFGPNWTAKTEYLYVDLSSSQFVITGMSNGYRFGTVRAGVNYHF